MSELLKIVLTLVGGFAAFVFGQVATRFFLDPIQEQRKVISEIIDSLIFLADLYSNPDNRQPPGAEKERSEAEKTLRRHASQLSSKTTMVVWYRLWVFLKIVQKRSGVDQACKGLIGLSNNLFSGTTDDARYFRNQISTGLNLPFI